MGREQQAVAQLGGWTASDLRDVTTDPAALDGSGRWVVVLPFSGPPVFARFAHWQPGSAVDVAGAWQGPSDWTSSMSRDAYMAAVESVRATIAEGGVYQANVCRVLEARMPSPDRSDIGGLHALLATGNPSPYGAMVRLPEQGLHLACASPELFLSRRGRVIESGPIKGTARTASGLTDKDAAENVMIVDLVRNDLSRVCDPGSVTVPALLAQEHHPGLVHLVSTVRGELASGAGWPAVIGATFPPGSVTGAPKIAALRVIDDVEPASREVYCGALGWVDADRREACLAVAIRTFWKDGDVLRFGTGAGITWDSDAAREWDETELKAARLVSVAARTWPAS